MNLIDRLVMGVSPARGLQRLRARRAADYLARMSYDGATTGRRASTLRSLGASADAAAFGQRARLRNVSRDLFRNAPTAIAAMRVIAGNTVGGIGILPSIECENDGLKKEVLARTERHLRSTAIDAYGEMSLPGLQTQVINAVVSDGEVLVRRRWRTGPYAKGLSLPVQIQVIEADHLYGGASARGQNDVVEGVEYGPTGRIEAYHLYRQHPGDSYRRVRPEIERVPASEILHIRRMDRPGQLRGVPWLAPVILTLADLRDFQDGELLKQKMASFMAGIIATETPSDDGIAIKDLSAGAIAEIDMGDEITWTNPPKREGFADFIKVNKRDVAACLGITYEALSGDLEGVSFTSGRMGRMEMDRNVETWQQQLMIAQFCQGLGRWLDEALALYHPFQDMPEWSWQWTAPRRPLIDPAREVPAKVIEIENGLTSRQRAQRELGRDPDTIRAERTEDAAQDAEAGLPAPASSGSTPADPADEDDQPGRPGNANARLIRLADTLDRIDGTAR